MNSYKAISRQEFSSGQYKIVPIRFEDRMDIMRWRNEQMYHLRQTKILTVEDQNNYFQKVVSNLFTEDKPNQLLFSFLENETCIGYGGLVHINYVDQNAEISFIMDTSFESTRFEELWVSYLELIEKVAFDELKLHKIFTFAFDLRPKLYIALEFAGYTKDGILKEHCYFEDSYLDVIIHKKIRNEFHLKKANKDHIKTTFNWASNPIIRLFSFSKEKIKFSDHERWFRNKISDKDCFYFIAYHNKKVIGSIRFDIDGDIAILSYLIDPESHGNGYGTQILDHGVTKLLAVTDRVKQISGYVMFENKASIHIFNKLGFKEERMEKNIHYCINV